MCNCHLVINRFRFVQREDKWVARQGANSILTATTPRGLSSQSLVLTEHLHQAEHMLWHMTLHEAGHTVAVRVRDCFNHQVTWKVRDGPLIGNVDIPDLFAIVKDSVHQIDSQFKFIDTPA